MPKKSKTPPIDIQDLTGKTSNRLSASANDILCATKLSNGNFEKPKIHPVSSSTYLAPFYS